MSLSQPVGVGTMRVFSSRRGGLLAGTTIASGNMLTFTPAQSLQPGELVRVTLPASTKSSIGTPLQMAQVYEFTAAVTRSTGVFEESSSVALSTLTRTDIYPRGVTTADVDNDGDQDLLASTDTYNPGTVSVRLNDGTGFFSGGSEVTVKDFSNGVTMADLNGDGYLDMIAGVSVRFNDGKGGFKGGSELPAYGDVLVKDLDGDGDLDLALASGYKQLTLFLNDGTGNFDGGTTLAGGRILAVGDVDGDGAQDLLYDNVSSFGGSLLVCRGTGDGTFSTSPIIVPVGTSSAPITIVALALSDLDGDGDLDLLVSDGLGSGIRRLLNDGQASFGPSALLSGSAGYSVAQLADLEGDGDPDVLGVGITKTSTNTACKLLNDGKGSFMVGSILVTTGSLSALATADVDGDGDLDLLTVGEQSRRARVWLNQNTLAATLTVSGTSPTRNQLAVPRSTAVAVSFSRSLDAGPAKLSGVRVTGAQRGDYLSPTVAGATWQLQPTKAFLPGEVVTVNATRAVSGSGAKLQTAQVFQFTAAAGAGPGTFAPTQRLGTSGYQPRRVLPADFNGDGKLDLCSLGLGQYGGVSIMLNVGGGKFNSARSPNVDSYPTDLSVNDMDGDGDLDLVVSSGSAYSIVPGEVRIYTNDGTGTFSAGPASVVGYSTEGIATGDLDGDGDADIVALNSTGQSQVLSNENDGTFTLVQSFTSGYNTDLTLGDIDNDGDLDLLASGSRNLSVHFNTGNGTFTPYVRLTVPAGGPPALADLDADGDLDALLCSGGEVSVLRNDGQGTFRVSTTVAVQGGGAGTGSVATGDIDGDGDLDFVSGGGSLAGYVSVRLNDGQGNFSGNYNPVVAPNLTMPLGVALADLDGDDDLDLPVLLFNLSGLVICLNQASIVTATQPGATTPVLALMPNPAHYTTRLVGAAPGATVQVLDATGRLQFTATATAAGTSQLALFGLASGLYMVRVGEQAMRLAVE